MPLINIRGTNTAMVVRDELSIGVIISVCPRHKNVSENIPVHDTAKYSPLQ